jgi:hypothetical protein
MSSLPTWATWSIAAAAVFSPVLAFLLAITVEVLVGVLRDAGMLPFLSLVAIGAIGWSLVRKPSVAFTSTPTSSSPKSR